MRTTPSPSRSAVSTESASRPASGSGMTSPVSGSMGRPSAARVAPSGASAWRTMYRSTTTSIEWRLYLSSFGASVMSTISPSTRTRTKPWRRAPSKTRSPFGLAVLDERAEDEQSGALGQRQHLVDDLLDGLALDGVAVGAMRDADPREQQAEVVVDLGHGADRRPRVAAMRPSGRSRSPATGRRSGRRPASPSGRGTGGRTRSGSRRTAAGPRRRSCRRRGWTCRCPTGR